MEVVSNNYMPGDSRLIDHIVYELKSQGIFDNFRKECIADVDTKPAYQNLRQRVEGSVSGFLRSQRWRPDMNKNHVREMLRRNISESGFLETGVERIVDQVVNPKINTIFLPLVENVVYKFLGIPKPSAFDDLKYSSVINDNNDLLPKDLEAVSPESEPFDKKLDITNDSLKLNDSKMDDEESPPFEPLDEPSKLLGHEENSVDSNLSGFSGLVSHDSNHSMEQTINKPVSMEMACDDSQISKQSSEDQLCIVIPDEVHLKMDISEDSSNSKTIDGQPKSSDGNSEVCSIFENVTKPEEQMKTDTFKKTDEKKSEKHRSSHKHKSRNDSKSEKDKKSDRDKKEHRDRSKHDSKDGRDKDKKDSKGRSSSSSKHSSSKKHSSDNKDGKSKDSKLKTELSNKSKDDSKTHNSSSKSKGDSKNHSKHNGKTKTDSSDSNKSSIKSSTKEEKSSKKEDKQHSRSDKHSSSSKKDKDKKSSKKETKDDHFGLKAKKSGRRSTDRDSSDGHSGTQSSSSSFAEVSALSQSQKTNQDSSTANSNSTSGDSGNSEQVEEKTVQDTIDQSKPPVLLKLIKPKFASNIFEAKKLMKIRKKLGKLEKQKQIELIGSNVSLSDEDNNRNIEEQPKPIDSIVTNSVPELELKPEPINEVVEVEEDLGVTQNAVISKDRWDAVEAKLSSAIDYDSYVDQSEIEENEEVNVVKVVEVDEDCVDDDSCLGYNESTLVSRKKMELLNKAIYKLEEDVMKRYKFYLLCLASKNVPAESSKEMDDFNKRLPKVDIVDVTIDNEIIITPSKGIKRLVDEQTDVHNNNKKNTQIEISCLDEKTNHVATKAKQPMKTITSKTKKPKLINNSISHLDNFNLPPSPAESDKSFTTIVDKNEMKNKKLRVHNTRNQNQRYSSDDLYKPRLQFSSTRRRANKNTD